MTTILERETIQILLDLLNPLHGDLDKQTYDAKVAMEFDMPPDYAHDVTITAQQERDLTQAICILENRICQDDTLTDALIRIIDSWRKTHPDLSYFETLTVIEGIGRILRNLRDDAERSGGR